MNRRLIYELAAGHFVAKHETRSFSPARHRQEPSRQAIVAVRSNKVTESSTARLTHSLRTSPTRGSTHPKGTAVRPRHRPLLIIDDLGMRKLRRQRPRISWSWSCDATERTSTLFTSQSPGGGLGQGARDAAAVAAYARRLLHQRARSQCGPSQLAHQASAAETLPREDATS